MTEAIYKVGDILEIECQYGMLSSDKKLRCLVLKCIKPGYEFIIYTLLVLKSDDSFTVTGVNQKDIILTAKRVDHIDISSFLSDEESTEPERTESEKCPGCETPKKKDKSDLDDWMLMTSVVMALRSSTNAKELKEKCEKLKEENEELRKERDMQKDTMVKAIDKLYEHGFRYSAIADILGLEDGVVASARIKGLNRSAG